MIYLGYTQPKCDCGRKLDFYRQESVERYYAITNEGFVGKVKRKHEELVDEPPYLSCECGKIYRVQLDDEGRLSRGDIYN